MSNKLVLVVLIIGGIVSAIIAVNLFFKYKSIEENRSLLDKSGVETKARVVSKNYSKTERLLFTMHKSQRFDSYSLEIRFDANSSSKGILSFNKALRGEKQDFDLTPNYKNVVIGVSSSRYNSVEEGDKLTVKYLASNPEIMELIGTDGNYSSNYLRSIAIGLLLFSGLIVYVLYVYFKTGKFI